MAARAKKKPSLPSPPPSCLGLMNRRQVASALGEISIRTVWNMVKSGKFPPPDFTHFGPKMPRWTVGLVNQWVADHKAPREPGVQ